MMGIIRLRYYDLRFGPLDAATTMIFFILNSEETSEESSELFVPSKCENLLHNIRYITVYIALINSLCYKLRLK